MQMYTAKVNCTPKKKFVFTFTYLMKQFFGRLKVPVRLEKSNWLFNCNRSAFRNIIVRITHWCVLFRACHWILFVWDGNE